MDASQWMPFNYPSPPSSAVGPLFPADQSPVTAISHTSTLDYMDSHFQGRPYPRDDFSQSPHRHSPSPAPPRVLSPHPYTRVDSVPPPPAPAPSTTGPGPVRTKPKHTKHRLRDIDRKRICEFHEQNPHARQEDIGAQFNVERSTVSKILRDKRRWLDVEEPDGDGEYNAHRPLRPSKFPALEWDLLESMERWHKQGKYIADHLIKDTALRLARKLYPDAADKFKASPGWVDNFKLRHGVRNGVWTRPDSANAYPRSPIGAMYVPDLPPVEEPSSSTSTQPPQPFALDPALAHADGASPPYTSGGISPQTTHDQTRSRRPSHERHDHASSSSRYRADNSAIEHSPDPYPHAQHHYAVDPHHSYPQHEHSAHYPGPETHSSYDRLVPTVYTNGAADVVVPGGLHTVCPEHPHRHPCQPQNNPLIDPTIQDAEDAVTSIIAFVDRTREPIITEKERQALRSIKCALFQFASGLPYDRTI